MSIINDALKKAREEKSKAAQVAGVSLPPQEKGRPDMQAPRPKRPKAAVGKEKALTDKTKTGPQPVIFIISAVIIIAAGGFLMVTRKALNPVDYPQPSAATPQKNLIEQSALIGTTGRPSLAAKQNFTAGGADFELTGIVHGEGSPMAVINGGVYMAGDIVGTAVVLEISEDKVILEEDNNTIELKVK